MTPAFSFLSQLFFPESMISDSADVSKGMTSSELIQVNQEAQSHRFRDTRATPEIISGASSVEGWKEKDIICFSLCY